MLDAYSLVLLDVERRIDDRQGTSEWEKSHAARS
jgi:hypothetical protein